MATCFVCVGRLFASRKRAANSEQPTAEHCSPVLQYCINTVLLWWSLNIHVFRLLHQASAGSVSSAVREDARSLGAVVFSSLFSFSFAFSSTFFFILLHLFHARICISSSPLLRVNATRYANSTFDLRAASHARTLRLASTGFCVPVGFVFVRDRMRT